MGTCIWRKNEKNNELYEIVVRCENTLVRKGYRCVANVGYLSGQRRFRIVKNFQNYFET